jgi:hypothetical protein
MGRVFTGLESILALGTALGSVAASGLIAAFGLRGALVAAGLVGPGGVLLALSGLRRIDADVRLAGKEVALLQRVAMLAPLPLATICRLAATASNEVVAPGTTVVREGSPGADVYVIVDGSAHVSAAGQTAGYLGSASASARFRRSRDVAGYPLSGRIRASNCCDSRGLSSFAWSPDTRRATRRPPRWSNGGLGARWQAQRWTRPALARGSQQDGPRKLCAPSNELAPQRGVNVQPVAGSLADQPSLSSTAPTTTHR